MTIKRHPLLLYEQHLNYISLVHPLIYLASIMSFLPKKLIRFHIIYNYQPNSKEYEMESGIIVRNLYDDTVILLGRFKDSIDENDIQFESRYISRNHARIWLMNKEV